MSRKNECGKLTAAKITPQVIRGLYAITPNEHDTAELLRKVRYALLGGAQVLQYRNKTVDEPLRLEQARLLRVLTHEFSVPLIINDDALLARQIDADGVHLGGADGSVTDARKVLGDRKIIGVSCYNRSDLARAAVRDGADYVAFGSFFHSMVKPDAVAATPDLLRWARGELAVPLVAIGGITLQNGAQLLAEGAHALAVISALFEAADIQCAAQQFTNLNHLKTN